MVVDPATVGDHPWDGVWPSFGKWVAIFGKVSYVRLVRLLRMGKVSYRLVMIGWLA